MLKTLLFYLNLSILCIRLILNLLFTGLIIIWQKTQEKRILEFSILFLICLICLFNFYIFKEKNEAKIKIIEVPGFEIQNKEIKSEKILLKEADLKEKMIFYQKMEKSAINNLGLFLSLSELNYLQDNLSLADYYLSEAQKIEPQIKYLEN